MHHTHAHSQFNCRMNSSIIPNSVTWPIPQVITYTPVDCVHWSPGEYIQRQVLLTWNFYQVKIQTVYGVEGEREPHAATHHSFCLSQEPTLPCVFGITGFSDPVVVQVAISDRSWGFVWLQCCVCVSIFHTTAIIAIVWPRSSPNQIFRYVLIMDFWCIKTVFTRWCWSTSSQPFAIKRGNTFATHPPTMQL